MRQKRQGSLFAAAMLLNAGRCAELIQAGADVNETDGAGYTPLSFIISTPKAATKVKGLVKLFIAAGADLDLQNNQGRTALHWAIFWGLPDVAGLLLDAGARTDIRDVGGTTALGLLEWRQKTDTREHSRAAARRYEKLEGLRERLLETQQSD